MVCEKNLNRQEHTYALPNERKVVKEYVRQFQRGETAGLLELVAKNYPLLTREEAFFRMRKRLRQRPALAGEARMTAARRAQVSQVSAADRKCDVVE
tara:strand:- start:826 stop:1116 length:291 start_codon:yes stop_codon:yes gene_type:complete